MESTNAIFNAIGGILGGTSSILLCLFAYLGKMHINRMQAELNNKVKFLAESALHVSKSQFDKEFTIYQSVWVKMVELHKITMLLRTENDLNLSAAEIKKKKNKNLKDFDKLFEELLIKINEEKPFYAAKIYKYIDSFINLCKEELSGFKYGDIGGTEYFKSSNVKKQQITKTLDLCCSAIRNRLESLVIVP